MKKFNILIIILSITLFCTSCSLAEKGQTKKKNINNSIFTKCKNPRPEICTMEYKPVCATKRIGEEKTYSTGCTACSDSKVIKYKQGQCEQ